MEAGYEEIARVQGSLKHGQESSEMMKCDMQAQSCKWKVGEASAPHGPLGQWPGACEKTQLAILINGVSHLKELTATQLKMTLDNVITKKQ